MNKYFLLSKILFFLLITPILTLAADSKNSESKTAEVESKEKTTPEASESTAGNDDDSLNLIENFYIIVTDKQIKFLNQTLEYKVIDNDSILVGDIVISTKNMQLFKKDPETMTFQAPMQFLVGGTLILKDPHGRAIWSQTIKDINEIEKVEEDRQKGSEGRTSSGLFYLHDVSAIEAQLAKNSFFTLCLFSESRVNRIQICTPNYTLKQKGDGWEPVLIKTVRKDHSLFVNGSEVGESGIIQFDQNIRTASLAAQLISGLSVEMRSDFVPLQLLDVTFNRANSSVNFKAREKIPGNKKAIPWEANVDTKESSLFIEAYGQVPLRQALSINTQMIPTQDQRPILLNNQTKTYSSSLTIKFKNADGLNLVTKTEGDTVETSGSEFEWTLNKIALGYNKAHLLEIGINKIKLLGSYEVERAEGWDLGLGLGGGSVGSSVKSETTTLSSSDNSFRGDLYFQKYFDGLLGMTGAANLLRWGTAMTFGAQAFSAAKTNSSFVDFDLIYRFTSGFYYVQPSTSLRVAYRSVTNSTASGRSTQNQWAGLKIAHDGPHQTTSILFGNFHSAQLGVYPACLNEECKGGSLVSASWQSRYNRNKKSYWSWKLIVEALQTKVNTTTTATTSTTELQGGLGFRF
ncbi:MAG: hypothetical protein RJB66_2667 [Pseudomonadota bacterium]|jgi:hypothetical protein